MKDLVIDNENKIYKTILFCMDNDNETRYTTIILNGKQQTLEINFTHFNRLIKKQNLNCSYTFEGKETKKFINIFAKNETDFIKTIKEQYSNISAHTELIAVADQNNIKYKFSYHKTLYDFGEIFDDTPILYYENGELIVPGFYEHCENGTTGIYTRDGFLYMKLPYKKGKLNGKAKAYYDKTKLILWEQKYIDNKLDGKCITYFRNGKIKRFYTFKMGIKDGLDRTYTPNGTLIKEEIWKHNDKINVKIFYINGKIHEETNYIKGKKEGIEKTYNEEGYLEYEIPFCNDLQHGLCKEYYPDGKIKHEAYFKKGLQHGKNKIYYENGQLKLEDTFKDDKTNGIARYYHKNGQLECSVKWKDGKEEGYDIHYYDTGEIDFKRFFIHGIQEKFLYAYFKSGKIKEKIAYHNDKKEGISKGFYENGNLKWEYNYRNGEKDGKCKTYYENGNIRFCIEYKDGLRDGFSIFYTKETSDIALKMLFINGKLIDLFYVDGVDGYLDKEGTTNFFRELNKLSKVDKKAKQDFPFYEELKDFINDYD